MSAQSPNEILHAMAIKILSEYCKDIKIKKITADNVIYLEDGSRYQIQVDENKKIYFEDLDAIYKPM